MGKHTPGHHIYPYLLRDVVIERPNQVWCADITYVPMPLGVLYLVAVMDWWSRYVVAWARSNSLEGTFCRTTLQQALGSGTPLISTLIRAVSSLPRPSPRCWTRRGCRSGWTGAGASLTTSVSNACGERSRTSTSTCVSTRWSRQYGRGWTPMSSFTTWSDRTKACAITRQLRSTSRDSACVTDGRCRNDGTVSHD